MSCSIRYASLEDFLNDLATNPKFSYAVQAFALYRNDGWLSVEEILGRSSEAGRILNDLAFERSDTSFSFSPCNLKVRYLFDEDFVNEGSALLVFNLVATRWVHLVWLSNQNEEIFEESRESGMDSEQAKARVHEFLCQSIKITHCQELSNNVNLYQFNPARECLFTFKLFGYDPVGSSEYIVVDRESGEVRYLGFHGE